MQGIEFLIKETEAKLLSYLEEELKEVFKDTWLPSHGIEHHKRVWRFSRRLLSGFSQKGHSFSKDFVEALLVASLMHDTGLTKTLSVEHGEKSALLAEDFLTKYSQWNNTLTEEMLQAIIQHDNKNYLVAEKSPVFPDLYTLLTVADDLDAFGAVGLYRYIEIYHLRNFKLSDMLPAIKDNLNQRYNLVKRIIATEGKLETERYRKGRLFLERLTINDLKEVTQGINQRKDLLSVNNSDEFKSEVLNDFHFTVRNELIQLS
jgi:hypothetical protein